MLRVATCSAKPAGLHRAAWACTPSRLPHQRALASKRPPVLPPPPPRRSTFALVGLMTTMCGATMASRDPQLSGFMTKHFVVSRDQLAHGRVHTLCTSALLAKAQLPNLVALAICGREVCRTLGGSRFLALFFTSGALANVVTLALNVQAPDLLPKRLVPLWESQSGVAGAVDSVVALNALLYPPSRLAMSRRWLRWFMWFYCAHWLIRDEGGHLLGLPGSAPRTAHATGVCCGLLAFLVLRRPPRRLIPHN